MVSMSLLVCLLAWFQLMNNPAVTYADAEHQGHLFWITCKWLKLLRKASHLQVFRNSAPSVARRHQCDIQILTKLLLKFNFSEKGTKIWHNLPQGFDITKYYSLT